MSKILVSRRFFAAAVFCGFAAFTHAPRVGAVEQAFEWVPELIEQDGTDEKLEDWHLGFEMGYRISGVHRWHYGTTTGSKDGAGGTFVVEFATPEGLRLASADFVVPLASLRTGNATRDLHMRADFRAEPTLTYQDPYVDAPEYKNIAFAFTKVKDKDVPALNEGNPKVSFTVVGNWTMRGVTKEIELPIVMELVDLKTETVRISTEVNFLFADYGIPRHKYLVAINDDNATVKLALLARPKTAGK